jgi:hypothetical protein
MRIFVIGAMSGLPGLTTNFGTAPSFPQQGNLGGGSPFFVDG